MSDYGTQFYESSGSTELLSEFIRRHHAEILTRWERAVRLLPSAQALSRPVLIDHLPQLLARLADSLEEVRLGNPPHSLESLPNEHALERLDAGYDLDEVVTEYALLRSTVEQLWEEAAPDRVSRREVTALNRAIDVALTSSVRRYARTRDRTLRALDRIAQAAAEEQVDLEQLLPRLLQVMVDTTEAVDAAVIMLVEADGTLRTRAAVGLEEELLVSFTLQPGEGFAGRIASQRTPLELRTASTDPLVVSPAIRSRGLRALYGVPLTRGHQVIGVAHIGSSTAYQFSNEDKVLFRTMVSRATSLIVQAQAADELRDSEERFRNLADNIAQLAWMADETGYTFWYNRRWYDYTGASPHSMLGWGWQKVHHPDHVQRVVEKIHHCFQTGETWEDTFPLRAADGSFRWFLSRAIPIRDPRGRVVRWFGTNTDVTEQREAEQVLRNSARFREQFIGILGHDLRNPLGAINASAELLVRRGGLTETQLKPVFRIANSAEKMARMINDLLDFTRGRLGEGIPVSKRQVDMQRVCREAVEELHVTHPERQLAYEALGNCWASVDPDRVAQVVSNLVRNALSHGEADTPVRVSVRDGGEEVVLEVWNRGAIAHQVMPTLFEPFTRPPTFARTSGNLGLGLYIVQQVVRAHRARLEVHSTLEEGTTFCIRWPRQ